MISFRRMTAARPAGAAAVMTAVVAWAPTAGCFVAAALGVIVVPSPVIAGTCSGIAVTR